MPGLVDDISQFIQGLIEEKEPFIISAVPKSLQEPLSSLIEPYKGQLAELSQKIADCKNVGVLKQAEKLLQQKLSAIAFFNKTGAAVGGTTAAVGCCYLTQFSILKTAAAAITGAVVGSLLVAEAMNKQIDGGKMGLIKKAPYAAIFSMLLKRVMEREIVLLEAKAATLERGRLFREGQPSLRQRHSSMIRS